MSDENCKSCTNCGKSFSVTRRKHHCRGCGKVVANFMCQFSFYCSLGNDIWDCVQLWITALSYVYTSLTDILQRLLWPVSSAAVFGPEDRANLCNLHSPYQERYSLRFRVKIECIYLTVSHFVSANDKAPLRFPDLKFTTANAYWLNTLLISWSSRINASN
jgi:hypothetical protein